MNARFWVYVHDWTKITLKPGQELNHWTYENHEEGWSAQGHTWRHEDGVVVRQTTNDGCDCDGRLTQNYDDHCPLDRLQAVEAYGDEAVFEGNRIMRPDWCELRSSQRDAYAEAMGY